MAILEAKWFCSAKLRNKYLPAEERGDWKNIIKVCTQIAREVNTLHNNELIHHCLSYKNVYIDTVEWTAFLRTDGDYVTHKSIRPAILPTPDFVAPEIFKTRHLRFDDPNRAQTSITTNRHSLAVLIYMLLLNRHPLIGGRILDSDPAKNEELSLGEKALFIEHPTDTSNRPKLEVLSPTELPQADIWKLPYTICGPYLKMLFERAFIDGLHNPVARPSADEWIVALELTRGLLQECYNPKCIHKYYVADIDSNPTCPFCDLK